MGILDFLRPQHVRVEVLPDPFPAASVTTMPNPVVRSAWWDGEKYPGGWGATDLLYPDFYTLRMRSADLFFRNLYARGLVRRLVTNEINTGLHLEACPEESILGMEPGTLDDWTEEVETRFQLWADTPYLCDHQEQHSFGELQALARLEALVAGDVLVAMRRDQSTGLPRIQLINASNVQTPTDRYIDRAGVNIVRYGVELDANKRQVAYFVLQPSGKFERIPAWGPKSGKRLAWLLYGTDKRLDDVRGQPLLSLVLQSVKEIDRYRDAVQRKATANGMIVGSVERDQPVTSPTRVAGGGATRKGTETATDSHGDERSFNTAEHIPGLFIDVLKPGEKLVAHHSQGTDEKFGDFEEAILCGVAWANEIPPEVLMLGFSNNYSASQAALNEFKLYLTKARTFHGQQFCKPVYAEWLYSEVINRKIAAEELFKVWNDPLAYDRLAAWLASDWAGQVKPTVDPLKSTKALREKLEAGLITYARACRESDGMKFSKVMREQRRERKLLAEVQAIGQPEPVAPVAPVQSAPPDRDDEDDPDKSDEDEDEKEGSGHVAHLRRLRA